MYFSSAAASGEALGVTGCDATLSSPRANAGAYKIASKSVRNIRRMWLIPLLRTSLTASQCFWQIFPIDYFGTAQQFLGIVILRHAPPGIPTHKEHGPWKIFLNALGEANVIVVPRWVARAVRTKFGEAKRF